ALITGSSLRPKGGRFEIARPVRGRHVDLDELEVLGPADDVVRNTRRLRQTTARLDRDVAIDPGEAELDPAFEDDDEVAGHVMPMPAGRLLERANGTDMLGADPAAGRGRKAEIAILDVRTQSLAGEC